MSAIDWILFSLGGVLSVVGILCLLVAIFKYFRSGGFALDNILWFIGSGILIVIGLILAVPYCKEILSEAISEAITEFFNNFWRKLIG